MYINQLIHKWNVFTAYNQRNSMFLVCLYKIEASKTSSVFGANISYTAKIAESVLLNLNLLRRETLRQVFEIIIDII